MKWTREAPGWYTSDAGGIIRYPSPKSDEMLEWAAKYGKTEDYNRRGWNVYPTLRHDPFDPFKLIARVGPAFSTLKDAQQAAALYFFAHAKPSAKATSIYQGGDFINVWLPVLDGRLVAGGSTLNIEGAAIRAARWIRNECRRRAEEVGMVEAKHVDQ